MDNLTPITREEMLMNDEPLTPITREEKILAGEDLNPVTRREYFLKKYRHAGGDVMVEGLEVTANGTYTAPEGKAYSPVEVDVPLPDNAYLLKTASGSLVSFSDGADLPMPSFICKIEAVQSGSGDPSPENVRPISGHTGLNAWVRGKNLLDITTVTIDGFTFIEDIDGYVSENPNNSDNRTWSYDKSQYKLIIPAGDWKLVIETKTPTSANKRGIIIRDSANNTIRELWADSYNSVGIKTINFTLTEKTNIGIMTKMYDAVARFMIVPQSASNDFEFYNPNSQTIQVSWQTEAGEVFGGYVDLVSGILTVTHYKKQLTRNMDWSKSSSGYNAFYVSGAKISPARKEGTAAICNIAKYSSESEYTSKPWYLTRDGSLGMSTDENIIGGTTIDNWKDYISNNTVEICYELATPITYQLTPQQIKSLLGYNNAWCDTGDVDIDYFAKEV